MRPVRTLARVAAVGLLLAGCTLWDRDTFQPTPEAPPPAPPGPPAPGPRVDARDPLVTVDYSTPDPVFRAPLSYAVRAAEARDWRVQYDVIAVVPSLAAAADGQQRAMTVMQAIMSDRVPASRIHLGLRADPSLTVPQVRVYVR